MPDRRLALVALAAALASCRGGCARKPPETRDALALLPADVAMVMVVDVAKLRDAPVMATLLRPDGGASPREKLIAAIKARLDDVATNAGFHPVLDVDTVVLALAKDGNAGAAVVRGRHLELTRLHAFLRAMQPESAPELQVASSKHGSRTLWSIRGEREAALFVDDQTLLIGYGGWAEKMADLVDGVGSARALASTEIVPVFRGVAGHSIGGVAPNPEFLTPFLESVESLDAGAAAHPALKFRGATWTVDVADGLVATFDAELANPADADLLAKKVKERKLDKGLRIRVEGAKVHADGDFEPDDLRSQLTDAVPFVLSLLKKH